MPDPIQNYETGEASVPGFVFPRASAIIILNLGLYMWKMGIKTLYQTEL